MRLSRITAQNVEDASETLWIVAYLNDENFLVLTDGKSPCELETKGSILYGNEWCKFALVEDEGDWAILDWIDEYEDDTGSLEILNRPLEKDVRIKYICADGDFVYRITNIEESSRTL